jgi:Ca2+-binding EF-hand superfamily protein
VKRTEKVPEGQGNSIRANIWKLLQSPEHDTDNSAEVDASPDTTLIVHFFGMKGKDVLTYQDFHRFMDNLQTEVLELEFNEFSHGMPTIHEQDFARILLRYTILTKEAHEEYLDRLSKRIPHSQEISFRDFKEFFQFLNNLDDFALAMRIYTYADHPISEADFQRSVKACTGQNLNSHLIHVVFQLFDADGDGKLSHKEFIAVMKERVHRGTKLANPGRWDSFKTCIKNEMKNV